MSALAFMVTPSGARFDPRRDYEAFVRTYGQGLSLVMLQSRWWAFHRQRAAWAVRVDVLDFLAFICRECPSDREAIIRWPAEYVQSFYGIVSAGRAVHDYGAY